jgi:hypothetical protein
LFFFEIFINFVFSVNDTYKDFEVGRVVLFTSPISTRWARGKQGNTAKGFGMEVPDDDECLKVKKLLYDHLPICLCNIGDINYSRINRALNRLFLFERPEKLERKSLFGGQFRYLFGITDDIAYALEGLVGSLQIYDPSKSIDSVESLRLIHLNFNVNNHLFYHVFVSNMVCCLVFEELRKLEKRKMWDELNCYKNQHVTIYADLFKQYVFSQLLVKNHVVLTSMGNNDDDYEYEFTKSKRKFFNCVIHTPIQIWYEDIDHRHMLGTTPVDEDLLYCPTDRICYTVDAILLQRKINAKGEYVILVKFIQVTAGEKRDVSPGAFFAMFMLVKLIKANNLCKVVVFFYFIMPEDIYNKFNSSEADYLRDLFDDIRILVLKFDEIQYLSRNASGTNEPNKKSKANNITKRQNKTPPLFEGFVLENTAVAKEENEYSSLNKDYSMVFENISITPTSFDDVRLKLIWNKDIECVIDNSIVTVNNYNCSGNISPVCVLPPVERNEFVKPKKKRGRLSSSALEIKSKQVSSIIHLVLEDSYLQGIPFLFSKYLKICTLFYKIKSSPEEMWKKKQILNLLPEIKTKIPFIDDGSGNSIFEIYFDGSFKEEEIYTLLGCLDLSLLNVHTQSLRNVWKVKLKFYQNVFVAQTNFLKTISEILLSVGINTNLQKK